MISKRLTGKNGIKASGGATRRNAHKETIPINTDGEPRPVQSADKANPRPVRIKAESADAREKRLAARKARTLRAFQTTYENRHSKAS